ncbi:uncharacterized protein LOC141605469 [Silene latifolia]|uniref:uncharacterized protein LOC141605469 n=1 Tax=Silene latifolia TaxID=37657 RepID=UPI003D7724D2
MICNRIQVLYSDPAQHYHQLHQIFTVRDVNTNQVVVLQQCSLLHGVLSHIMVLFPHLVHHCITMPFQSVGEYEKHEKNAWSVDFSRTEPSLLISGGGDCKVKVWST